MAARRVASSTPPRLIAASPRPYAPGAVSAWVSAFSAAAPLTAIAATMSGAVTLAARAATPSVVHRRFCHAVGSFIRVFSVFSREPS